MKKHLKIFIIYFPIVLLGLQILADLSYLVAPAWYFNNGYYLNAFLGTNVLVVLFFLSFTFLFKFCEVSKWAAIAEGLFALNNLIVQEDNLYNILFQVIVGLLAIILTFNYYIKKIIYQ